MGRVATRHRAEIEPMLPTGVQLAKPRAARPRRTPASPPRPRAGAGGFRLNWRRAPDSRVATSRRRPPLAADSDTPENLAEVVGQADR